MSKRILADIKNVNEQETKSLRIHYSPNGEDITKGRALIFGPGGSPYEDLPIFLDIQYPSDYPFSSPKVKFITYDGITRFHPNLYIEGKVCLSILGTWQGPGWTSVMNLRTVLLSILGLLDNEPLLHEPGYATSKGAVVSKTYTEFIQFRSLQYIVSCLHGWLNKTPSYMNLLNDFEEEWAEALPQIWKNTKQRLELLAAKPQVSWPSIVYSMSGQSNYPELLAKLNEMKQKFEEKGFKL
jgi:ubiquitin-conjugating enzyme E2 Z